MNSLIEIPMDNGKNLYIETIISSENSDSALVQATSPKKILKKSKDFLSDSIEQIKWFANSISNSIIDSDLCPDEFELGFSVKISADASIIVSTINTEANISVRLKWKKHNED